MSVFVFVVKEAFDLPSLPQDYKNEIKISKIVEFCNKRLSEFFVFTAKRELDENFRSSKRKLEMMLSSSDESFRKLLIVCEIKRFG